jgi:hypothetical protein
VACRDRVVKERWETVVDKGKSIGTGRSRRRAEDGGSGAWRWIEGGERTMSEEEESRVGTEENCDRWPCFGRVGVVGREIDGRTTGAQEKRGESGHARQGPNSTETVKRPRNHQWRNSRTAPESRWDAGRMEMGPGSGNVGEGLAAMEVVSQLMVHGGPRWPTAVWPA